VRGHTVAPPGGHYAIISDNDGGLGCVFGRLPLMASFSDFLATFDPDRGKRGRQFEHFVKWFLKNDPEWTTQVDEVWLWNDYPRQWGRDCGIDLVFKDKNGGTWAVQAKCYSSDYEITKSDVDKFLSESNRRKSIIGF
jgi:predicted helicase